MYENVITLPKVDEVPKINFIWHANLFKSYDFCGKIKLPISICFVS